GMTASLSADFTASRSGAPFLARACLRASGMRPRSAWPIWSSIWSAEASFFSTHSSPRRILRDSAPWKFHGRNTRNCWKQRSTEPRVSRAHRLRLAENDAQQKAGLFALIRRRHFRLLLAVLQPDVIDWVLDSIEAGAIGKHPAGKDT